MTLHFAARIVVPESVAQPGLYYRENVVKSLQLFETLSALGQTRVVFSSSASIYATPSGGDFRVTEAGALAPGSPYARSKAMVEQMLQDLCAASTGGAGLRGIALRYFNPIGADPQLRSGLHAADPSHILGRMVSAARGRLPNFSVTGTDYPTRDGTGLRDYIHVWDLALAHVAAAERFDGAFSQAGEGSQGYLPINVGTGSGVTVRELLRAFEAASGLSLPVAEAPRRPGDTAGAYADISRAAALLGWQPQHSTEEAIRTALVWDERREAVLES